MDVVCLTIMIFAGNCQNNYGYFQIVMPMVPQAWLIMHLILSCNSELVIHFMADFDWDL